MPGFPGPLGWVAAPTPAVQRSPLGGACDPPVRGVACLQHQALRPLLDWSAAGPVPPVPGPVPWSWTGPLVRDRAAATASADRRNPGRPRRFATPGRCPAARWRGTRYLPRQPPSRGRPGPAGPGRWRRNGIAGRSAACGGKLRACARRGTRVRRPATGYAPGCSVPWLRRRPVSGCRCDRAATGPPVRSRRRGRHMARQPGSED
jgi:hypothetical protein